MPNEGVGGTTLIARAKGSKFRDGTLSAKNVFFIYLFLEISNVIQKFCFSHRNRIFQAV